MSAVELELYKTHSQPLAQLVPALAAVYQGVVKVGSQQQQQKTVALFNTDFKLAFTDRRSEDFRHALEVVVRKVGAYSAIVHKQRAAIGRLLVAENDHLHEVSAGQPVYKVATPNLPRPSMQSDVTEKKAKKKKKKEKKKKEKLTVDDSDNASDEPRQHLTAEDRRRLAKKAFDIFQGRQQMVKQKHMALLKQNAAFGRTVEQSPDAEDVEVLENIHLALLNNYISNKAESLSAGAYATRVAIEGEKLSIMSPIGNLAKAVAVLIKEGLTAEQMQLVYERDLYTIVVLMRHTLPRKVKSDVLLKLIDTASTGCLGALVALKKIPPTFADEAAKYLERETMTGVIETSQLALSTGALGNRVPGAVLSERDWIVLFESVAQGEENYLASIRSK